MKSLGGNGQPVTQGVVTVEEALRYAMSLPVATTISGIDSLAVLRQDLAIARGFKPMTDEEMKALRRCSRRADLDGAVLEGYKARMLTWSRSQPAFARGRRALLEQDLGNLQGAAREAVRKLFSEFEMAISLAEDAVRARESLSPWGVARAMGYPVPDGPEAFPLRIVSPPQSAW